jgi:hypothetical protein
MLSASVIMIDSEPRLPVRVPPCQQDWQPARPGACQAETVGEPGARRQASESGSPLLQASDRDRRQPDTPKLGRAGVAPSRRPARRGAAAAAVTLGRAGGGRGPVVTGESVSNSELGPVRADCDF